MENLNYSQRGYRLLWALHAGYVGFCFFRFRGCSLNNSFLETNGWRPNMQSEGC